MLRRPAPKPPDLGEQLDGWSSDRSLSWRNPEPRKGNIPTTPTPFVGVVSGLLGADCRGRPVIEPHSKPVAADGKITMTTSTLAKLLLTSAASLALIAAVGCESESADTAGDDATEAVENAVDAAGDAAEATGDAAEDVADDVADEMDGDSN